MVIFKSRVEEDRSVKTISFESRAKEDRSIIFQQKVNTSCGGGQKYHFTRIISKLRAKKERNHSKPRAEEERNITLNLVQKKREVRGSSRTLNLMRKKGRASICQESQTSCGRGREYYPNLVRKRKGTSKFSNYFESQAEENSNCKVHQKILNFTRNRGRKSGIIVMENLECVR